jgi:hypothetical protein
MSENSFVYMACGARMYTKTANIDRQMNKPTTGLSTQHIARSNILETGARGALGLGLYFDRYGFLCPESSNFLKSQSIQNRYLLP